MPLRNSREAPKTFHGKHEDIQHFIQHYDKLLVKYRVTDACDHCECILDYCSLEVQDFIRCSEHYVRKDWHRLRREILTWYDVEKARTRYHPSDLGHYTMKTKNKIINNLSQWKKYCVKYKTIAGTLFLQGQLTKDNMDVYFWLGVHKDLRKILENRILQHVPRRNHKDTYTMREINEAAEWYFRRNRPETMVVNAGDYDIDDYGMYNNASSEDEDSDDESDDSDYETYRRKRREKKDRRHSRKEKAKEKQKTARKVGASDGTESTVRPSGTTTEVTDLIRRLNKMTIDDPEYAPTYYSVLTLDKTGIAANCVSPPKIQKGWQTDRRPPRPPNDAPRTTLSASTPATYPNNITLGERAETPAPPENRPGCFGCGKQGHIAINCPEVFELQRAGIVKIDEENRRVTMGNDAFIRRFAGETLVQAAKRLAAPRVMLGMTDPEYFGAYYGAGEMEEPPRRTAHFAEESDEEDMLPMEDEDMGRTSSEEDSDSGHEEVYLSIPRNQWPTKGKQVYGADRPTHSTRTARKLAFDGVHIPRRESSHDKVKDLEPEPTKAANQKKAPLPTEKPTASKMREILSDVRPYDSRQSRIAEVQDVEMKEIPLEKSARAEPLAKENRSSAKPDMERVPSRSAKNLSKPTTITEAGQGETKAAGHQSEVQSSVNLPAIVDRILDLQLPMTVREALAASKEIRNSLQDVVSLKNVKAVLMNANSPLVAQWTWPRAEGVLIRVEMEISGRRVVVIIDTGSQLDVVRSDVAACVLHHHLLTLSSSQPHTTVLSGQCFNIDFRIQTVRLTEYGTATCPVTVLSLEGMAKF
ncbi:hypothetical protein C8R45DRAFT_1109933 [Mycena sanguinolenta]|nr:hypothetical protein C8R45DRAFT_1109933 [Mycena sanguinolenta]